MKEPLQFAFKDVIDELDAFGGAAKEFLFRGAPDILADYAEQLRQLQQSTRESALMWEIPAARPLETRASLGGHNPSGKGISVYAAIDARWAVRRVPHRSGKRRPADFFAMAGEASVRVRIRAAAADDERSRSSRDLELAMWRMELGDVSSPGCHFHVQILGQSPNPPFPNSLAVPRLPSLAVTPAAAFEYVIGELFQTEWTKHLMLSKSSFLRWRKLQCEALTRLLQWQIDEIRAAPASPWSSLKGAKPRADLFIS